MLKHSTNVNHTIFKWPVYEGPQKQKILSKK